MISFFWEYNLSIGNALLGPIVNNHLFFYFGLHKNTQLSEKFFENS